MQEQEPPDLGIELSEELRGILEEEAAEAEIRAAIDAAAEEGIIITREEAIRTILSNIRNQQETNQ